ncbi:penicillin-binding protein [Virgibacillus profundi]|uniref:serine-type D-Ala-D-Ala carboxypeptidase n=1 Tax=Virgibacillus profundi TaxID=2024555 RepID=A0A2A2ID47_9BACI|nr:penicillin-binding protein 2 [Virgibacillus profundi]PAV29055.1 penicillin-binding protein [Virgibacillus profundi]PXY53224.1 penicillin-binding protein 2 [Virgibacillus profundi]
MKTKKKKKAQLPFRLNILFFVVFLLFSVLIFQLGVVQILNGEDFQKEIDRTIQDTTKIPVPRGKIYDRNHDVIVDNKPLYSITYTPPKGTQAKERLEVAKDLAKYISMDSEEILDGITDRNRREYWYLENKEEAVDRLSDEAKEKLDDTKEYSETLKLITDEEIDGFSKEVLEVIAIKKELDKAYSLTPQTVKNEDVTPEEYARVAEHLDELPGINATTDWNREHPYESTFKSLLGSISTQEEGIPAEKEEYYLTRGYSRNDRVGKSGLEEQYEEILRGRKEQIQYTTDKSGKVIDAKTVVQGERGKDLVLTIDMEFQEEVDKIVREELLTALGNYSNPYLEDALAVVINPQTGELLAVSGQHYDRENNEYENAAYKTLYDSHLPGSIVKGATVLAGYESGVITPWQTFYDRPIIIKDSDPKGSWRNLGTVDDLDALRMSSNVYMFYIAMRMGGHYNFQQHDSLVFTNDNYFQEMRNYFRQFGLGVKTGIDFPYEATGFVGESTAGQLLDYAIGQYDTFTTMQMAQYVATIANDGYRVRPHFLKEIREPNNAEGELGPVRKSVSTEVLNRIQMSNSHIERVQEGFRQAFQSPGGTGYSYWADKDYNPAGKTGTAENEFYENSVQIKTENLTLVGYAPFDEPEIAFAVVVPRLGTQSQQHSINHAIGERIMDTYFDMKEDRDEEEQEDTEE